jgi:hypothetical protein
MIHRKIKEWHAMSTMFALKRKTEREQAFFQFLCLLGAMIGAALLHPILPTLMEETSETTLKGGVENPLTCQGQFSSVEKKITTNKNF